MSQTQIPAISCIVINMIRIIGLGFFASVRNDHSRCRVWANKEVCKKMMIPERIIYVQ